jgi:preprotein translocase subunit SecE
MDKDNIIKDSGKDSKDKEKEQKKRARAAAAKKRVSFAEYMRGVRTEMKKVVWPTRKELGSFTAVVMIACTFFALFFAGIDYLVFGALQLVLGITMF